MGDIGDELVEVTVMASSPDGMIKAEARYGDRVDVSFVPGAYRRYHASALSHQLSRLAPVLWVRYRRAYLESLDAYLGGLHDDGDERPEDRTFWVRMEQVVARGVSQGRALTVHSRAMTGWDFDIADGALDTLSEAEFVAELRGAVLDLLIDYRAQVVLLTDEVYGLGLPKWWRTGTMRDGRGE
jgi:hypothetical protein